MLVRRKIGMTSHIVSFWSDCWTRNHFQKQISYYKNQTSIKKALCMHRCMWWQELDNRCLLHYFLKNYLSVSLYVFECLCVQVLSEDRRRHQIFWSGSYRWLRVAKQGPKLRSSEIAAGVLKCFTTFLALNTLFFFKSLTLNLELSFRYID